MINELKNYFKTWWTIILRPIYFYTILKEENWKEKALSFLIITSWILALLAAIVAFVIQYIPIGSTLVSGVSGFKLIIVLPVLIALAAVFFAITFLILGGVFCFGFFIVFSLLAIALHYICLGFKGSGSMNGIIQSLFYSTAPLLLGAVIFFLMILVKYSNLDFAVFRSGYNFIYFLIVLYMYGLWAIAAKKNYGLPKWKAFLAATVPAVLLLIFAVLFDKIALCKIEPWIS